MELRITNRGDLESAKEVLIIEGIFFREDEALSCLELDPRDKEEASAGLNAAEIEHTWGYPPEDEVEEFFDDGDGFGDSSLLDE